MENNSLILDSVILQIEKYEPHKTANGKNDATFFVASDDVDLADLQRYRHEAQTDYLIAINATGKDFECLKLADNVISCLANEIELAMFSFKSLVLGDGLIGFDWNDVRTAIHNRKHIQFIQSYSDDENCVTNACDRLVAKLHDRKSDFPLKAVMINTLADDGFGFEQLDFIAKCLEENLNIDEANIFYQLCLFDEFDYWEKGEQGCCICMLLIYSEEENDIAPGIIEHDRPKKSPKPTQTAGNSIQEYLKRQQQRNKNG